VLKRYRSIEEMPGLPPLRAYDPENLRAAIEVSAVCYALNPWRFPPGVHKHASVAEAARVRERWLAHGAEAPRRQQPLSPAVESGTRGPDRE
jgi:hypothetical protein